MWKYSFLRELHSSLKATPACREQSIPVTNKKKIFTWSNLGKTLKLGKSWQVLRQHGNIYCLIKSPAQKANVKGQLIEFLRIFFFRNMRSFLARGERVSDKAAKIVTLTKEYLLSWKDMWFMQRTQQGNIAGSKTSKAILTECIC